MSYNTIAQFRSYSITSGSFDGVPDAVIQETMNIAANEIDSALINHHTLPFNSGSIPQVVFEAERVISAFRLWMTMGFDPGAKQDFLYQRYLEVYGTPEKPDTGLLGYWRFGRALLTSNNDKDPSIATISYRVVGQQPRGWYTQVPGQPPNKQFIS